MSWRRAAMLAVALVALVVAWQAQATVTVEATQQGDPQVTMLLVLDAGDQSVQRSFWTHYVDARERLARVVDRSFLARLGPRDRVRIGAFGSRLTLSPHYTSDRREAAAAVLNALTAATADRFGPSPIWDVVAEALADLSTITSEVVPTKAVSDRRAIVLMTDGEATGNVRSYAEVLADATARGVPIYIVSTAVDLVIPQGFDQVLRSRPTTRLRQLAEATGGLFLQPRDADREYRPRLVWESFASYEKTRTHNTPPAWYRDPAAAFTAIADRIARRGRAPPAGSQPSTLDRRP